MFAIETNRLTLRNYEARDRAELVALLTDERVMRHVDRGALDEAAAGALWDKLIEEFYPRGRRTIWGVWRRDDGLYVGHAAIRPRPARPADWEISYLLRPECWGRGFASEIARRLVAYGFAELSRPEVFATIDEDHGASIRVAEKAGMSFLRWETDEDGRFAVYAVAAPGGDR